MTALYNKLYEAVKACYCYKSKADQQSITNELWKAAKANKQEQLSDLVGHTINELNAKAQISSHKKDIRTFFARNKNLTTVARLATTSSTPAVSTTSDAHPVSANSSLQLTSAEVSVVPTSSVSLPSTRRAPAQEKFKQSLRRSVVLWTV